MEISKKAKSLLIINTIFFIVVLCVPILNNSKQLFNSLNLFLIAVVGISLVISAVVYLKIRTGNTSKKSEDLNNSIEENPTPPETKDDFNPLAVEVIKADPVIAARNKLVREARMKEKGAIGEKSIEFEAFPDDVNILDEFEQFKKNTEADFDAMVNQTSEPETHDDINLDDYDEITTRTFPVDYDELPFEEN